MSNYTQTRQAVSTSVDELDRLKMNYQFALEQLTTDRDFWMNDSIEKGKQLEQKEKRIEWLEKAYLQSKNMSKWTDDVLSHPNIQQTRDRVLLNELTKRTMRVVPGPDGKYRVSSSELMSSTSLKKDAVMSGMASLKSMGVDVDTEPIPGKGNHKRYIYSISQEIKDNPRSAIKPDKSNYGGTREVILCPNCGSSKNAHSNRNKCTDCSHEWGTPWKANNRDAAAQAHDDLKEEDVTPEQKEEPTTQSSLFEEFEKKPEPAPKPTPTPATRPIVGRFPNRPCFKCGAEEWEWDEVFDLPKCGRCG